MNVEQFIEESNRIEGIFRTVTAEEIDEFYRFIELPGVTIEDLSRFVRIYQPGARLREYYGLDVRVGNHTPPRGGPAIPTTLQRILDDANSGIDSAHRTHRRYESLHPFTDGNGRSGRMLWAWQVGIENALSLGFLHRWYYQSLAGAVL